MFKKTFYGDKARWQFIFDKLASFSKEQGDNLDLETLEKLFENKIVEVVPELTLQEKVSRDRKVKVLEFEKTELNKKYKYIQEEYLRLNNEYESLLYLEEYRKEPKPYQLSKSQKNSESAIILQWSDYHIGEKITKAQTNNLNEYNLEICKKRVKTLLNNSFKLIEREKYFGKTDVLILHLGGDFINGYIHEENRETNSLSPIEEVQFATDLLINSIETISKNFNFKSIKIICSRGNHARVTQKMRYSNEKETSLETLIYSTLVRVFKDNKNIEFYVPDSSVGYIKVLNRTIRFIHGQQVKYSDGIGGISIPLNKKLHKWNATRHADMTLMCHYHQLSFLDGAVINGSLCGYNAFSESFAFKFQPPQQSFLVLNSKYGFCSQHPIFCE